MSSYFDYFCKTIGKKNGSNDTEKIQGTCFSMCPQHEMCLREKEKLVHLLEVVGSERQLVKSYSRSAADTNMAVPHHLRPFSVLRNTTDYLLFEVTKRTDVPINIVYDFVNDRLRAVRQDITIQRLEADECALLLEPMVRFYVYFGYRLQGLPMKDFDPVLNKKYLLECIKWFLSCCDTLESPHSIKSYELNNTFSGLSISNQGNGYDRVLIESLYILCNLDDVHPLLRYISLPKELKRDARLQLSYQIAVANMRGNFVRVTRSLGRLCPLSYCAVCLHLPHMQKRALHVLSHACSPRLGVPISSICHWLGFTSNWETRSVCQHYGFIVDGDMVTLQKTAFNNSVTVPVPKIQFLDHGKMDLDYIFTYKH